MAYRDKEKAKEYQRQYYLKKTKIKRLTHPPKSYYVKKDPEDVAKNRHLGGIKSQETLKAKMGEDAYKQAHVELGKKGAEALKNTGKPIGFQGGYASEAGKLGARARALKSKHKKIRDKYKG